MKTVDISQYNNCQDWNRIRKEVELIVFRSSIGNIADKKYIGYADACGIPYGVQHYVKAGNENEAKYEARFFVEQANKARIRPLFYIADIEYKSQTKDTTNTVCRSFLNELKLLGCERVGLYISQEKRAWIKKDIIDMCNIMWIPRYGKNDGNIPEDKYRPIYPCDIWQQTDRGHVDGIEGYVDIDLFNNTEMLKKIKTAPNGKTVVVTGDTVNIRQGNSVDQSVILVAGKGDVYEYVAEAENGWRAISIGGDVGWISGKQSEVK